MWELADAGSPENWLGKWNLCDGDDSYDFINDQC